MASGKELNREIVALRVDLDTKQSKIEAQTKIMDSLNKQQFEMLNEIEDLKSQLATSRSANNILWRNYKRVHEILYKAMRWMDVSVDDETLHHIANLRMADGEPSWYANAARELGWDVDWEAMYWSRH